MARKPVRVGGSFAPPLPDAKLTEYESLANNAPGQIKDEMLKLIKMLRVFRETPDSKKPGKPHATGIAMVVPLEDEEVKRIWDYVPWGDEADDHINECDQIGKLFDKLPTGTQELKDSILEIAPDGSERLLLFGIDEVEYMEDESGTPKPKEGYSYRRHRVVDPKARDLRNAAFHLLWFARELALDREPITNDRLG